MAANIEIESSEANFNLSATSGFARTTIELAEKIKKGQFKMGKLGGRQTTLPEIWRAALSA